MFRIVGVMIVLSLILSGCAAPVDEGGAHERPAVRLACSDPCGLEIDAGDTRWEPWVAVDPTDPSHLVASSHDLTTSTAEGRFGNWASSHVSRDGGATWTTLRLPGDGDPAHPLLRYQSLDDSMMTFLPDGTLVWSVLARNTVSSPGLLMDTGNDLVVLRSTDGGLTFPEMTVVAEGAGQIVVPPQDGDHLDEYVIGYVNHDKQWIAVEDDGGLLMVWSTNHMGNGACGAGADFGDCTDLRFATSTDGGRTWSDPGLIEGGERYSGAYPLVRADGAWVVTYRNTDRQEAVVATSTDRGTTWDLQVVGRTTKFPILAPGDGPNGERLYLTYPESEDAGPDGAQRLVLRWSDDGGTTWTQGLLLDDPDVDGRMIPAMAATPTGVYVTYWYPLEDGAEHRAVLVQNETIADRHVLGTSTLRSSATGDYMGIAALPDGDAFAVWTTGTADGMSLYGSRLTMQADA